MGKKEKVKKQKEIRDNVMVGATPTCRKSQLCCENVVDPIFSTYTESET